jgi:hypothetical protein
MLVLVITTEIPWATNTQPAYAEGFGAAGAHMSRRSEAKEERRTSNVQLKIADYGPGTTDN